LKNLSIFVFVFLTLLPFFLMAKKKQPEKNLFQQKRNKIPLILTLE